MVEMSDLNENAFDVIWRIENIEIWLQSRKDSLYSPQFLVETLTNTRWKLSLSRVFYLGEKYLSFTLQRDVEVNGPEFIVLNYELSFLACDESSLISKSHSMKFASKTVSQELNVKEIEILDDKKDIYMPNNILTVRCKVWKTWSMASKGGRCFIRSEIGIKCLNLNSTIDNFSRIDHSFYMIVKFISPFSDISFMSFEAYRQNNGCFVLARMEVESKSVSLHDCELFVFDCNGKKLSLFTSNHLASLLNPYERFRFTSDLKISDFKRYTQNDVLKIQLEIKYHPGIKSESIEYDHNNDKNVVDESANPENGHTSNAEKVQSSLSLSEYNGESNSNENNEDECSDRYLPATTFKKDLTCLYNDRLFCDVKLQTDTETFPAHRCVLSARSPVFKEMFSSEIKEIGECISITNISSETLRRLLQFIYTDCTGDLEMQSAKDLYSASDKYDIVSLKQRCVSFMKDNFSPSNVCEVLVLADMHQDKDLESSAQEFVLMYDKEVFCSEEWKLFMIKFSGIAAQVMYLKCMEE